MRRRVLAAALLGALVATALGVYGVSGALRVRQMRVEIEAAEREIAALRVQADRLIATIDRLKNDPAYLEKLAREERGLVREGEVILKFPSTER